MIQLNVPFSQKDQAKAKGARWHPEKKRWYIPTGVDPMPFYDWLPSEEKEKIDHLMATETQQKGISLSNLLARVHKAVGDQFQVPVWVHCEIAALNRHRSGHLYLELIETDANGREICKNKAIIWKDKVSKLMEKFQTHTEQTLKEGIKVLLLAEVEFNINFGLSLKINDIDPEFTLGGIEAKINTIRNALKKENIYAQNKQHPTLVNFTNIAVISPAGAAGLGDFKAEADLLEFYELCNFDYYEATFQGKQTNQSISSTFQQLESTFSKDIYDAVVLIRGGGAKTDLHFLNEYDIARAICQCQLPVIVGIGHERDKVILDEIAFKSLDTPSKVAQFITQQIVNQAREIIENMDYIKSASKELVHRGYYFINSNINEIFQQSKRLTQQAQHNNEQTLNFIKEKSTKLVYNEQRLNRQLINEIFSLSKTIVTEQDRNNTDNIRTIISEAKNKTHLTFNEIKGIMQEIDAYNPEKVLEKGYALIRKNQKIIKNIDDIDNDDIIEIQIGNQKQTFRITKE